MIAALALAAAGCAKPPTGFESPVPAARLDAITEAAETGDRSAIPNLITMLESDDPVVRMAAIRTLERLTGETLGYDYAGPEWERRDKVAAWVEWYRENQPGGGPGTQPGARTTDSGGVTTP